LSANITLIVAAAENDVIGRDTGEIPWRVKTDMKRFRSLTMGHPIIVGRKTFETFAKPLTGRQNIVMTRDATFEAPGCIVVHDVEAAIAAAESEDIFVIGGGGIYDAFLPVANTIELTRVHAEPEGEAHFRFDENDWTVAAEESHPANPEVDDHEAFTFLTLKRR
jgi:dihydrofolate reductase